MKYCSECGAQNITTSIPKNDTLLRDICIDCGTIHYSNPKVIVGCLPIWQKQVLLCKRNIPPREGFWNLPCGFLENQETVEEGVKRELLEEANAKVNLQHLHTVFSLPHISQVYMIFLGYLQSNSFSCGVESKEVSLFYEKDIPWKDIAFESSTYSLKQYFQNKNSSITNVGNIALKDATFLN